MHIKIGIVTALTGRATGEIFLTIENEEQVLAAEVLSNEQAIELAEGLAKTATIAEHQRTQAIIEDEHTRFHKA